MFKDYFHSQLNSAKPLTEEQIESMCQDRFNTQKTLNKPIEEGTDFTPKTYFGKKYEVGDVIIYFNYMEKPNEMILNKFCTSEFKQLEETFRYKNTQQNLPVLEKK